MFTKRLFLILMVCVMASLIACDGDSPSTPSTPATTTTTAPPTPPPPSNAVVTLTGSYECIDSFCDFAVFDLTLRNTGGAGANLNFIRVENRNGQPILELGADHFINTFGNNRLEAGQTLDFFLTSQLGYVVIVNFTDDNGRSGNAEYYPDLPR